MRVPLPELLFTALLAAAFAALGEILLRRRIRGLASANESMLVGMGASAAALFPLTLLLGRRALLAEAAVLGAALVLRTAARIRSGDRGGPGERRAPPAQRTAPPETPPASADPLGRWLLGAVGLVIAAFAALNFRYTYVWDGLLIWATKAQFLSHAGGLTREWYPGDVYDLRHLAYPLLVPLCESLIGVLRGGFHFDVTKPVFFLFYLSLLAGTHSAARASSSARAAALATLLVALVPALVSGPAAGAYADMPQAAVVAAVTAAALNPRRDGRSALPWLIGALTAVKAEGTILAVIACAAVALFWILDAGSFWRRAASEKTSLAIVGAFFLLRLTYIRWIDAPGAPYDVYSGSPAAALARLPDVARLCIAELLQPRQWGLLWPAFFLAAAALVAGAPLREKVLAAAVVAALAVLMVPFLFTTWPLELQISQAYSRLASQVAPAAVVALVLGYRTARNRIDATRVLR